MIDRTLLLCLLLIALGWIPHRADGQAPPSVPQHVDATDIPKAQGHWGEDAVGFRWVEEDSADSRWNQTQIGPFLCSSLPTPNGTVAKSIAIRVGAGQLASVCYDLNDLTLRCGWANGFLTFTPARFGIIAPPRIEGDIQFTAPGGSAWTDHAVNYRGLYLHGDRVVLSYTVDGCQIFDSPWAVLQDAQVIFTRTLEVAPSPTPLKLVLGSPEVAIQVQATGNEAKLVSEPGQPPLLTMGPHRQTIRVTVFMGPANAAKTLAAVVASHPPAQDLRAWTQPGPARWGNPLQTHGQLGADDAAYTIDSIEVPFDNPYHALMFISGHDFFTAAGSAAVCTLHGDVWRVDGIDEDLGEISWRRFATGLFQPLGLKIVDDHVFVLGRDQITRLHDLNHDGEADYYESFNHGADTSAGGHDFSACLETDSQGNFYYVSQRGVHRIAADGSRYETIATGLRNPNGMSIGPRDVITTAPQEGEWTPASAVFEVTPGGYYGFGGPQRTSQRPRGYDPPLFWIPRRVDNSTGGQVWVPDKGWGPLSGQLLTLSFGQCRVLLNPLEPRRDTLPAKWPVAGGDRNVRLPSKQGVIPESAQYLQGGCLALPWYFDSGITRGRFSPHDGQLYITGLRGWVSAAANDGCFQRVRYTGRPVYAPIGVRTLANGIALTFSSRLDKSIAEDPDSFDVQRWNYRYGIQYGSEEYRVSTPEAVGRDKVPVQSATLVDDRTVFLQIDDLRPVMQTSISYALRSIDGHAMRDTYYHTINYVPTVAMDTSRLTLKPSRDRTAQSAEDLRPGLRWEFRVMSPTGDVSRTAVSTDSLDARVSRMAALYVPAGQGPTPFLKPGRFQATANGFLQLDLRDEMTFSVQGRGSVRLRINDHEVIAAEGDDLSQAIRRTVPLYKGQNRIQIAYRSPETGNAVLRVRWQSDAFAAEAIPPTVLYHDRNDDRLAARDRLRQGRSLVARRKCINCHSLDADSWRSTDLAVMPELRDDAPDLRGTGQRLRPAWLAQYLAEPDTLRTDRCMPRLLRGTPTQVRQQAADLVAFLQSIEAEPAVTTREPTTAETASVDHAEALQRGTLLYEQLGCIVCHTTATKTAQDEFKRYSLAWVTHKFVDGELERYLRHPHEHYRASRMPDFQLSEYESYALATHLSSTADGKLQDWTDRLAGDIRRGEQLFEQHACAACHNAHSAKPPAMAPPWRELNPERPGCLHREAPHDHRGPYYELSDDDRQAILQFVSSNADALLRRCEAEAADRLMESFSCARCHDRDGRTAIRTDILVEEGSGQLPEFFPELTWTGEKLHADWTMELLKGHITPRTRPWLNARMPSFPHYAEDLSIGMAQQHGVSPARADKSLPNHELITIGHELTQKTGLDCVQCHGIGDQMPQGDDRTQISLGINFEDVEQRLRYDYYRQFVLDPPRYDARTKMPKLAADGQTTKLQRFYGGDARRQFDAIWNYLQHLKRSPTETSVEKQTSIEQIESKRDVE